MQLRRLNFALKYLKYILLASHRRGHGIHSPFAFNLIHNVWQQHLNAGILEKLRFLDAKNRKDSILVNVRRVGAGSLVTKKEMRSVSSIFRSASIPKRYGRLLYATTAYFKPDMVLEFGTSLGISSAWLALGNPQCELYTVEAIAALAEKARENHRAIGLQNTHILNLDFEQFMQEFDLPKKKKYLLYIDGNHTRKATLQMFDFALQHLYTRHLVVIIDDIHWSAGMEQAWQQIQKHHQVTLTLDIFRMGFVFFNSDLYPQNFIINY